MGIGQPYVRIDLNPMLESTLSPSQGLWICPLTWQCTVQYLGALKPGDGAVLLGGNVQERILRRCRRIHQPKHESGRWCEYSQGPSVAKSLFCLPAACRVSSKQTKINFGSNRNKPKQDLFRVCFGLFRETKKTHFRFVSVFRTYIETTETNRTVS